MEQSVVGIFFCLGGGRGVYLRGWGGGDYLRVGGTEWDLCDLMTNPTTRRKKYSNFPDCTKCFIFTI